MQNKKRYNYLPRHLKNTSCNGRAMWKKCVGKISVLSLLSLLITACLYTNEYHPPSTSSVPVTWKTPDTLYTNSNINLAYLAWWETFHDPTLNHLMEQGLRQNNHVNAAMANVEASEGALKAVQLNWLPTASGNIGYSSFPDLGYPGILLAVIPSYTINLFSQMKEEKKAQYDVTATQAERDAIKLAVIGQIASSYFTYSSQKEQRQLFTQLEADLTKLVRISDAIHQGGLVSQIDVEKAKQQLNSIRAQKRVIQHNINLSQYALSYLLNQNPHAISLSKQFSQLKGDHMVIGALPLKVLENRPDMRQATNELKASNEEIGLTFSNVLPSVQLSIARGDVGTQPNGSDLGQAIHFNQALLQVPLIEPSVYGQIKEAKGLNKASYYHYLDTLRKALRDVDTDMSAHDFYSKRYNDILAAKNNQQRVYELNERLYAQGLISHMKLLESKVNVDTLLIQLNQSKLEQLITIVQLYQDLGGGYIAKS